MFCFCRDYYRTIGKNCGWTNKRCRVCHFPFDFLRNWNVYTSPFVERTNKRYCFNNCYGRLWGEAETHRGNQRYFPEFEFQANGVNYRVTSSAGSGFGLVKIGDRIDLYYTPENPRLFYVPVLHRRDNRCACLFCGIGILFPLLGLFAPKVRAFFSFLP